MIREAIRSRRVELVDMKRPDPTAPIRPRTGMVAVSWIEAGDEWHGRESKVDRSIGKIKRYAPDWPEAGGAVSK